MSYLDKEGLVYLWGKLKALLDSKAESDHTHNYASSSSAGGSATSAVKLTSSAGSATQPVYFKSGKPVKTTYTLGKSVPSDAVFTDTNTTYTIGREGENVVLIGSDGTVSEININSELDLDGGSPADTVYDNNVDGGNP